MKARQTPPLGTKFVHINRSHSVEEIDSEVPPSSRQSMALLAKPISTSTEAREAPQSEHDYCPEEDLMQLANITFPDLSTLQNVRKTVTGASPTNIASLY